VHAYTYFVCIHTNEAQECCQTDAAHANTTHLGILCINGRVLSSDVDLETSEGLLEHRECLLLCAVHQFGGGHRLRKLRGNSLDLWREVLGGRVHHSVVHLQHRKRTKQ